MDGRSGDSVTLMEVKAFKNGNLHIKLNQSFILRLNVEFGRLMGWVKDAAQASDEMGVDLEEAAQSFGSNLHLNNTLKLGRA